MLIDCMAENNRHIFFCLSEHSVYEEMYDIIEEIAKDHEHYAFITKEYHVYPDFHGNRSPIADPTLKVFMQRNFRPLFFFLFCYNILR